MYLQGKRIASLLVIFTTITFSPVMESRAEISDLPKEINATLANVPNLANTDKTGPLCDIVRELEKQSGIKINFRVQPFPRSIENVIKGKADFHLPLIEPVSTEGLPYSFSTATLSVVNFILYTHKDKILDIENLEGIDLETDSSHVYLFPIEIKPSTCVLCSLKKLNAGRIDGFIYSDVAVDDLIRKEKLTNIHRNLYRRFNVKFVIPKNSQGSLVDKFLTKYVNQLYENGTMDRYPSLKPDEYVEWQPHTDL